jgi:hypothetical protein
MIPDLPLFGVVKDQQLRMVQGSGDKVQGKLIQQPFYPPCTLHLIPRGFRSAHRAGSLAFSTEKADSQTKVSTESLRSGKLFLVIFFS